MAAARIRVDPLVERATHASRVRHVVLAREVRRIVCDEKAMGSGHPAGKRIRLSSRRVSSYACDESR